MEFGFSLPSRGQAATMSDLAMRLTPRQLAALVEDVLEVLFRYRDAGPDGGEHLRPIALTERQIAHQFCSSTKRW